MLQQMDFRRRGRAPARPTVIRSILLPSLLSLLDVRSWYLGGQGRAEDAPLRPRQAHGRSNQGHPVSQAKLRLPNPAARDRQLMPQHQQLHIFHIQAAPATGAPSKARTAR
jgi:hypothetical protein